MKTILRTSKLTSSSRLFLTAILGLGLIFGASGSVLLANPVETDASISSISPNPAYIHQGVTVQVAVVVRPPAVGTPQGDVEVRSGQTPVCLIHLDGSGQGSCNLTFGSPGDVPLKAVYLGTDAYLPAASGDEYLKVLPQVVPQVVVSSHNPNPSVINRDVMVNVSVLGGPAATGNVTVYRSGADCQSPGPAAATDKCSASVGGGSASCNLGLNQAGTVSICAAYSGDVAHTSGTSGSVSHRVSNSNTFTSIISISPEPSKVAEATWVNFTVTSPDSPSPTGTVTVESGPDFCSAPVSAGQCQLTFTIGGQRSVLASYTPESAPNLQSSVSDPYSHQVNGAPSHIFIEPASIKAISFKGTPIGKLRISGDVGGSSIEYQLMPGLGDDQNHLFSIVKDELILNETVFLSQKYISIRVKAITESNLWGDEILLLKVKSNASSTSPGSDPGLPNTGFSPGVLTRISKQPDGLEYDKQVDMQLQIPRIGLNVVVVGVPLSSEGWNLEWLGPSQAGFLGGTSPLGLAGTSAIAAHRTNFDGKAGPFIYLSGVLLGDYFQISSGGKTYQYQVQSIKLVDPDDLSVLMHKDGSWVTLLTCSDYVARTESYRQRLAVEAKLVGVK